MIDTPTHRVSVQRYTETDEEVDDGMGGTSPEKDWITVVDKVPGRYVDHQSPGVEQEDHGERVIDQPQVTIHPRHVGHIEDEQFVLDVSYGSNWRVVIHGLTDEKRRRQITEIDERYGTTHLPANVILYLEVQS